MAPMPSRERMRAAVAEALAASGARPARVRLTATPRPTLLVEVVARGAGARRAGRGHGGERARRLVAGEPPSPSTRRSPTPATGSPSAGPRRPAPTTRCCSTPTGAWARPRWRTSSSRPAPAPVTAPARGLLAGVARAIAMEAVGAREEALPEADWRGAREIVLTNAVAGALAVVAVDGAPVGDGPPGALARGDRHCACATPGVGSRARRPRGRPVARKAQKTLDPDGQYAPADLLVSTARPRVQEHVDGALELLPAREVVYRLVDERGPISIADLARELPAIAPRAVHPPYTEDPELYLLRLVAGAGRELPPLCDMQTIVRALADAPEPDPDYGFRSPVDDRRQGADARPPPAPAVPPATGGPPAEAGAHVRARPRARVGRAARPPWRRGGPAGASP